MKRENEKQLQNVKRNQEQDDRKRAKEIDKLCKKYESEIAKREEDIMSLQDERDFYKKNCAPQFQMYSRVKEKEDLKKQLFEATSRQKTEFQMNLFGVMRSVYIKIERDILIQRLGQLETMNISPLVKCTECNKKISTLFCKICDQTFCSSCFHEYHTFLNIMTHQPSSLSRTSDRLNALNMNLNNSESENNQDHQYNKASDQQTVKEFDGWNGWKKFEYFVLPTYKKNPLHSYLIYIYQQFRSEYIENNGINEGKEVIDINRFFRLRENTALKGKFIIQETKAFQNIINMTEFNIEDKLFLNRIAFLVFKRHGSQATFTHFFSFCKILQVRKYLTTIQLILETDEPSYFTNFITIFNILMPNNLPKIHIMYIGRFTKQITLKLLKIYYYQLQLNFPLKIQVNIKLNITYLSQLNRKQSQFHVYFNIFQKNLYRQFQIQKYPFAFNLYYKILIFKKEGYAEQKFILLLDFIDEDDSQQIERDEVKNIFQSSFLQAQSDQTKIDSVIDIIFNDKKSMSRLDIGKIFLYSQDQNPILHAFLISLLQEKKC